MIKVTTDCTSCQHLEVCRYVNNAKDDADKLREMIYDEGSNEYGKWAAMSHARHVTIAFSCDLFKKRQEYTTR